MTRPTTETLIEVCEATWPAAALHRLGPWILREGRGGGQRVSAATAEAPFAETDIDAAETAMLAMDQVPIFQIRKGDEALDAALEARGYAVVDPVNFYAAPIAEIAEGELPPMTSFTIWPPLAVMKEVWELGGIGPGRLAVMHRALGPKTSVMGRRNDRVAGTAFIGISGNIAMVHALEVVPEQRRQKSAVYMMRQAARWAQDQGAEWLSLIVTRANDPANALYASLGMSIVGHYHYRKKCAQRGQSS